MYYAFGKLSLPLVRIVWMYSIKLYPCEREEKSSELHLSEYVTLLLQSEFRATLSFMLHGQQLLQFLAIMM